MVEGGFMHMGFESPETSLTGKMIMEIGSKEAVASEKIDPAVDVEIETGFNLVSESSFGVIDFVKGIGNGGACGVGIGLEILKRNTYAGTEVEAEIPANGNIVVDIEHEGDIYDFAGNASFCGARGGGCVDVVHSAGKVRDLKLEAPHIHEDTKGTGGIPAGLGMESFFVDVVGEFDIAVPIEGTRAGEVESGDAVEEVAFVFNLGGDKVGLGDEWGCTKEQ